MKKILISIIVFLSLSLNISAKEKCPWKLGDPIIKTGPCKNDKTKETKTKKKIFKDGSKLGETASNIGGKAKDVSKKVLSKLNTDSKLTDWIKNKKK